jgi:hypothetical protein
MTLPISTFSLIDLSHAHCWSHLDCLVHARKNKKVVTPIIDDGIGIFIKQNLPYKTGDFSSSTNFDDYAI